MATIIKGEDRTITVELLDAFGDPFDVSTATEIEAKFCPETGSTLLSRTLTATQISIVNSLNKVAIDLDAAFSATIRAGEEESFELHVTIAGKVRIFQRDLIGTLNVYAQMEC